MTKRRKRRKAPKTRTKYRTRTKTVYRTRKAPRRRRRNPSRARSYARQTFLGVNIPGAAKSVLPLLLGALAGKAVAKRFSDSGAETSNWQWSNYLLCLAGGLGAALGTSAIFKGTRATAQKVFEGALLLTAYKFVTNEIAPRSPALERYFGQDPEEERLIESAAAAIDPYSGLFGEVYEEPEGDFQMLGQRLEPATARMGQFVEPATARMGMDVTKDFDAAYR